MQNGLRHGGGFPALEVSDDHAMVPEWHHAEGAAVKRGFWSPLDAVVGWRAGGHDSDCSRRKLSALNVTVAAPAIASTKRVVRLNMTGLVAAHTRNGPNSSTSTARTVCVFRAPPATMPSSAPTTMPQPMHRNYPCLRALAKSTADSPAMNVATAPMTSGGKFTPTVSSTIGTSASRNRRERNFFILHPLKGRLIRCRPRRRIPDGNASR